MKLWNLIKKMMGGTFYEIIYIHIYIYMVEKQVLIYIKKKYQPINVCSETVNDKLIRMPTAINP